jgi:hypothetical protein
MSTKTMQPVDLMRVRQFARAEFCVVTRLTQRALNRRKAAWNRRYQHVDTKRARTCRDASRITMQDRITDRLTFTHVDFFGDVHAPLSGVGVFSIALV